MSKDTISRLDPKHPEYEATAAAVKGMMARGDHQAVAEIITGMIAGELELEDVVAPLLGELKWSDVTGKDQRFQAPVKVIGNKAVTMENGRALPTAKIISNKVHVPLEEIATPEYPVDTRDLKAGDLVTVQMIKEKAMQALIVRKAFRLYRLLCSGTRMVDKTATNTRLTVIEDDGTFTSGTDLPRYVLELRRKVEDVISRLQDEIGGRPQVKGFCRQVTYDLISRANLPSSIDWYVLPAAGEADEIGDRETRPYFTEGDIVLIAPGAANCAEVEELEPSDRQISHWQVGYAWRWAHKWILWDDKYLRRFVILPKKASGETAGTLVVDTFSATEMSLYSTVPVDVNTINTTNLIVSATEDGTHISGLTYTVTVDADLRHIQITFGGSVPTAGNTYYVRSIASGIADTYGGANHYLAAMDAVSFSVGHISGS